MTKHVPLWFLLTRHDDPAVPPAPPTPPTPPAVPPTGDPVDKPLGPNGEKALQAERDARQALERQVAALAPLAKLAEVLGGGDAAKGKTELEQMAARQATFEQTLADERAARYKAEVAQEKGLTTAQAARLVGSTKEELAADADSLKALFPTAPAVPPVVPELQPDPSQGRGGTPPTTDFRTADKATLDAELAKYGRRSY